MSDEPRGPSVFLSWSGSEADRPAALWLERALRRFRLPKRLQREQGLPPRVERVEVDPHPAAAALDEEGERRLRDCEYLIVVCSPDGSTRARMEAAIGRFRSLRRDDEILALLIRGEPCDAFPSALLTARRVIRDPDGTTREVLAAVEPLAADIRASRSERPAELRRLARLRLLACLFRIRFDDLRRREHERAARRLRNAAAVGVATILTFSALGLWAVQSRAEAQERGALAAVNTRLAVAARAKQTAALAAAKEAKREADTAAGLEREARRKHEQERSAAEDARRDEERAKFDAQRMEAEARRAAALALEAEQLAEQRALEAQRGKEAEEAARLTALEHARSARAARASLYTEVGRQALLADEAEAALPYLGDASLTGDASPVLQTLLAEALRRAPPFAPEHVTLPSYPDVPRPEDRVVPGGAAWLPDGAGLLVVQANGHVRVLDPRTGVALRTLAEATTGAPVAHALAIPRRDRLILLHADGRLRILEISSGSERRAVPGVAQAPQRMVADEDGRTVVIAGDGLVALSLTGTGDPVRLHRREGLVLDVVVRPGGDYVACSQARQSGLYDVRSGKEVRALSARGDPVRLAWSPSGRWLAASAGKQVNLLDVENGGPPVPIPLRAEVPHPAFFETEDVLHLSSGPERIRWSVASRRPLRRAIGGTWLTSRTEASPDGSRAASVEVDGSVEVWDTRTLGLLARMDHIGAEVEEVGFSSSGEQLFTIDGAGRLRLWTIPRSANARTLSLKTTDEGYRFAQFSPDGRFVLDQSGVGSASLFDAATGIERFALQGLKATPSFGCFSGDGARLAVTADGGAVDVFETTTGRRVRTIDTGADVVALDRSGGRLLTCPAGRESALWDVETGRLLRKLDRSEMLFAKRAEFHPREDWIVAAGLSGAAIWDATTGRIKTVLDEEGMRVELVRLSQDGRRVVGWGYGTRGCVVWDCESGRLISVLRGHDSGAFEACFDSAGERVLTAGIDGTARIWSVSNGAALSVLVGHRGQVTSCAFHPRGHLVATGGEDKSVRLWDAERGEPLYVHPEPGHVSATQFDAQGTRLLVLNSFAVTLLDTSEALPMAADLEPELARRTRFRLEGERLAGPLR